ncbi:MAG TPA: hypothetical protein VNY35_05685 [Solirubrobacteraceae bacterium]|nr:hypothetical protein [Solirubrobacteraceae bacterium]
MKAPTAAARRRVVPEVPAVCLLAKPVMSRQRFGGLIVLRGYLLVALVLAIVKIMETAIK